MPYNCIECGYYWDWDVAAPYACPDCHATSTFMWCKREKKDRGRQATPEGWICPKCRETDKKIYFRGVCKPCYHQLSSLEVQHSPRTPAKKTQEKTKNQGNNSRPYQFKKDEKRWCPDCGQLVEPNIPKCRICNPFCEGCKEYKHLYKGSLCKDCYDKAQRNKPSPQGRPSQAVEPASTPLTVATPLSPLVESNPELTPYNADGKDTKVCKKCGLVLAHNAGQCPQCDGPPNSATSDKAKTSPRITRKPRNPRNPNKLTREQILKEISTIKDDFPDKDIETLKKMVFQLYFKYIQAYPDEEEDKIIAIFSITPYQDQALKEMVESYRMYPTRSEAIRTAINDLIYKSQQLPKYKFKAKKTRKPKPMKEEEAK
ncbi:MAG: type II toxin-antitoxin system ParD family antitoxin [Candidatus Thorarchaeota archaeon]